MSAEDQAGGFSQPTVCELYNIRGSSQAKKSVMQLREVDFPFLVGRGANTCRVMCMDKRVSSQHVRIHRSLETGHIFITNIAKNDVFVNDVKIPLNEAIRLKTGDQVSLLLSMIKHDPKAPFGDSMYCPLSFNVRILDESSSLDLSTPFVHQDFQWLRGKLGDGYFSTVRRVVALKDGRYTDQQYACKQIDKRRYAQFAKQQRTSNTILTEFRIMSQLEHPNVVQLQAVFDNEQHHYLVLELVAGCDLLTYCMDHGPLPEQEAAFIMRQVLLGLNFMHKQNIVHRDLKPENILLAVLEPETTRLTAKIADFGLSKQLLDEDTLMSTFCGTKNYLAPEVARNRRRAATDPDSWYTKKVDVWALGVIMFIMVSRTEPFADGDGLLSQIESGHYDMSSAPWMHISELTKSFIRLCLSHKPEDRPFVHELLEHELMRSIDERKLTTRDSKTFADLLASANYGTSPSGAAVDNIVVGLQQGTTHAAHAAANDLTSVGGSTDLPAVFGGAQVQPSVGAGASVAAQKRARDVDVDF